MSDNKMSVKLDKQFHRRWRIAAAHLDCRQITLVRDAIEAAVQSPSRALAVAGADDPGAGSAQFLGDVDDELRAGAAASAQAAGMGLAPWVRRALAVHLSESGL